MQNKIRISIPPRLPFKQRNIIQPRIVARNGSAVTLTQGQCADVKNINGENAIPTTNL